MKGNTQDVWRSFVVNAASEPRLSIVKDAGQPKSNSPSTSGSVLAWDPYDVWLKRVKEPRDRREPRSAPR